MQAATALSRGPLAGPSSFSHRTTTSSEVSQLRIPSSRLPFSQPFSFPSKIQNGHRWLCQAANEPSLYQPFRPPPSVAPPEEETVQGTKEEMLQRLTERMGLWHEWAPLISLLQKQGVSPKEIDEVTGLTGVEQNMTVVGAQVYKSLGAQGFPEDQLRFFDIAGSGVLYELRVLAVNQRRSAAEYIIDNNLDAKGVRELAKAIKDHERKRGGEGRDAFTQAPGDAMAFAFYRNAKEARSEQERESLLEQGLSVVVTEAGRKKLEELLIKNKDVKKSVTARLQLVRLQRDETTPRAIPVVGALSEVSAADVEAAPVARTDTLFPIFTTTGHGKWVAVPSWTAISEAQAPVGILHPDAKTLPGDAGARTSGGPALVVVNRNDRALSDEHYYLVEKTGEPGLALIQGSDADASGQVLGRVVVAVRPPSKNEEIEEIDWV
ncbi:hypothetical protein KFL_001090310 [Klebsormidium nitens]|uniref:Rubisco accumulation factor 1 C-terminal domain-containing protein n=1 Tax=Klebsormidium nitens TaxID=105231 RepID=A0A1Y1HUT7_KLENI|nr:hypothetical protein KFL_001090310 [Klebsormidium nitens]|eukprot:GAQ82384.1 hypothetical protein KFL_001090310 [Klebsormidium nitens]